MTRDAKLHTLYGLKFNPFLPDVPLEALYVPPPLESFLQRCENHVTEGGSAMLTGVPALRPTLLVLDPFVRLHRVDENVSAEVAPLLDFLRTLQRRYQTAVVLVHHARKGAAHLRAGQALRGSSELHAWGDSNLYLRRTGDSDQLALAIE